MFLLQTVKPEDATGEVAEAYAVFPPQVGVPEPARLMSASPGMLTRMTETIKYYKSQRELSFPLLTAIRFLAARRFCYDHCVALNAGMLRSQGVEEGELAAMAEDPAKAPLEPRETALLAFVMKSLDAPGEVGEADVAALRDLGWSETAIFDAVAHGANMAGPAILFNALSKK